MSASSLTKKKSVTIPADVIADFDLVGRGRSFSAYVTEALRHRIAIDKLELFVEEAEQKWGPVPDDVMAQVRADKTAARAEQTW